MSQLKIVVVLILSMVISSCSVNPVTGQKEFSLVSAEQEVAIGAQNYQPSQQAQGGRYYLDPEIQVYVADVGRKLAAVSDRPDLPYEFVVLNNPTPNAWALPGGKIAVNRGLLIHLDSEAELAAVLGHEIVHAAARHSAAQMTRGTLIGIGASVIGIAGQDSSLGQLAGSAAQVGAAAWMARYGREDELESDAYGMEYMARAGYNPQGAVDLQRTFVKLSEGRQADFISGLFASHPPSQERVNANINKAATLPRGNDFKERYQKTIAQLKKDQPAYEAQEQAIKALNNKDAKTAMAQLDRAISIQPRDAYSWELRGYAWQMQENSVNAEKAFGTAIDKNPDYFSPYLGRGVLRYKQEQFSVAKADLNRSFKLLPTQPAGYYLGEIALRENNTDQAIAYFQVAAQGNNEMAKSASTKLARLELTTSPEKYIASGVRVTEAGRLQILLQNNSPVTVKNLQIKLSERISAFMVGNSQVLEAEITLSPGKRVAIDTAITGLNAEDGKAFLSQVISVTIVE